MFTIAQKLKSKWNTTFSLFKWKMSEKTLYVRAVIFSRWKLSKRKLVFHFFKPICNTSFRHLLPFLGEREWFLQICNDHIHDHNDVWPLTLWHSLPIWKTNLYAAKQHLGPVSIKRSIFQVDSFSPLFDIALMLVSTVLQETGIGYCLEKKGPEVNHLFFIHI